MTTRTVFHSWTRLRRHAAAACAALVLLGCEPALAEPPSAAARGAGVSGAAAEPAAAPAAAQQQRRTQRRPAARPAARRPAPVATAANTRHTTPRGSAALASDVGSMLGSHTRSGQWGVMIVSLTRGDTLFSHNAELLMQPASNMKLFTAALALERFHPQHQFTTDVLRTGPVSSDGVLRGDLVLRGGGDPAFSRRFLPGGVGAPVSLLADLVAGTGVKRVTGNLIADATAFEPQLIPDGWQSRYLQAGYAARVSALSLNENLIWVAVTPGRGGNATVWLEPFTDLPIVASVRTVAGRDARIIARTRADGVVEVRGTIGANAGTRRYLMVAEDPAAFTAGAFRSALSERGITIDGPTQYTGTPAQATLVAMLPSPPLSRLLAIMNRESVNHYAELIFRNAARTSPMGAQGSAERANAMLRRFMAEQVGAGEESVLAADGSGLSVLNLTSARALVQLLDYSHRARWSDVFHASLPVAGESELLRNRMRNTPAQGNLHAKTGTTNTVISLAGYVASVNGELLAFAFIYNGTDRWNARVTIDQIGATLASFARE